MDEPRIPTQLQLRQRDRAMLNRIKALQTGGSMSSAASFVLDRAGEQVISWLEEGFRLRPSSYQADANQTPINYQADANQTPINYQADANQTPISDAMSDLDALLA